LSQACWNTLAVGLLISKSTRPRRVVDDRTVTDTVAVVPRGAVADVPFVVHPADVRLAASAPWRETTSTEPKAATRAATAMSIDRRVRFAGATAPEHWWDMAGSIRGRSEVFIVAKTRFLSSRHQIDIIGTVAAEATHAGRLPKVRQGHPQPIDRDLPRLVAAAQQFAGGVFARWAAVLPGAPTETE
jgi:hypothetical protein